jgi:hypothetical protein
LKSAMSLRNGGLSLVGAFLLVLPVGMEAVAVVFMGGTTVMNADRTSTCERTHGRRSRTRLLATM